MPWRAMLVALVACGRVGFGIETDARPAFDIAPVIRGNVAGISVGAQHTCAVLTTGDVYCWGGNSQGEVGDGMSSAIQSTPVAVAGLGSAATRVAASTDSTCAVVSSGNVRCWGYDGWGELGDGMIRASPMPSPVDVISLVSTAVDVIGGGGPQACAVLATGDMKCWGWNGGGQLGNGSSGGATPTPVDVGSLGVVTRAAPNALGPYVCAIVAPGSLRCWGYNPDGQLGDGTTTSRGVPLTVPLAAMVVAASTGANHACAVLANSDAWCWGQNTAGQLGDGTLTTSSSPVPVMGLAGPVLDISAGADHTCALLVDGGVQCWGGNTRGALGDGTKTGRVVPADVKLGGPATSVRVGNQLSCALLADRTVECWGANQAGQAGNGTTADAVVPTPVIALPSPS